MNNKILALKSMYSFTAVFDFPFIRLLLFKDFQSSSEVSLSSHISFIKHLMSLSNFGKLENILLKGKPTFMWLYLKLSDVTLHCEKLRYR